VLGLFYLLSQVISTGQQWYRLKDNIHIFKTTDYQQEILTNPLGTTNFQKDFKDYQTLIFALGDSYTHGTGLQVDCSYPFQLETSAKVSRKIVLTISKKQFNILK